MTPCKDPWAAPLESPVARGIPACGVWLLACTKVVDTCICECWMARPRGDALHEYMKRLCEAWGDFAGVTPQLHGDSRQKLYVRWRFLGTDF